MRHLSARHNSGDPAASHREGLTCGATCKSQMYRRIHEKSYQQFFSIALAPIVTHVGDLRVAFSRSASTSAMDSGSGFPSVSGTIAIEAAPQQHDTANSQYGIEGQEGATVSAAGARTPPRPSICTNHSASVRGRPHYSNGGMTRESPGIQRRDQSFARSLGATRSCRCTHHCMRP